MHLAEHTDARGPHVPFEADYLASPEFYALSIKIAYALRALRLVFVDLCSLVLSITAKLTLTLEGPTMQTARGAFALNEPQSMCCDRGERRDTQRYPSEPRRPPQGTPLLLQKKESSPMPVSPLQQWLIVGWYHPYRLLRMRMTGATSASFGSSSEPPPEQRQSSAAECHVNALHYCGHSGPVPARLCGLYKRKGSLALHLWPAARSER